jgi:hypothetical protein
MAIESICAGCGKRLTVGDEFAQKKARCPSCGHIYTVARTEAASQSPDAPDRGPAAAETQAAPNEPPADAWYMHTPEGRIYGPVGQIQLDQWVREGRVTPDCQLRRGDDGPWQWASTVYGVLAQTVQPATTAGNPFAGGLSATPAASPDHQQPRSGGSVEPHRGALVLALGILSFVVSCPVLSVAAWWMGNEDLSAMSRGRMDPSGAGITQAGRILGMITTILWVTVFAICLFSMLLVLFSG